MVDGYSCPILSFIGHCTYPNVCIQYYISIYVYIHRKVIYKHFTKHLFPANFIIDTCDVYVFVQRRFQNLICSPALGIEYEIMGHSELVSWYQSLVFGSRVWHHSYELEWDSNPRPECQWFSRPVLLPLGHSALY